MSSASPSRARAPWSAPSRRCADARRCVIGLLRAAAGECRDEALLRRRERTAGETSDGEVPEHGRPSGEAEALEVAPLDLLGDGVAGEEGEPEPFAGGALDRLARAELPDARRPDPDRPQLLVDHLPRARAALAREEHEFGEPRRSEPAVPEGCEARLRDADDLVLEERLELDPLVGHDGADERELE